jgi:hypothetical protein
MRQYHKYFGQVSQFPERYNVDSPLSNDIQPTGNIQCVLYSIDDICQDKFGFDIDINELYSRVPHEDGKGTDPKKVIQEVLDYGIMWESSKRMDKPFKSAYSAHGGAYDAFSNVQSVITAEKCSIMAEGPWDVLWGVNLLMNKLENFNGYHSVSIKGWDIINGETMFIIEGHLGRYLYASRSVFNDWASKYGFNTHVLSEKPVSSLMQKLIKALTDLVGLLTLKKNSNMKNVYLTAKTLLGRHLTLDSDIPKTLGCGQAFSYLMKSCGYPIPKNGISGTIGCNEWLKENAEEISSPDQGAIIVSITEGDHHGHIGCIAKYDFMFPNDWGIMSNSSETGLWEVNWNYKDWRHYYENVLGLQTKFYKL